MESRGDSFKVERDAIIVIRSMLFEASRGVMDNNFVSEFSSYQFSSVSSRVTTLFIAL